MPASSPSTLVLATRRSPLARRQAELAREALRAMPGAPWKTVELLELTTTGDRQREWALAEHGGKGLFTRELEEALLDGRAHAAVHSAKDLPTELPAGLTLAGFLPRADARDVFVRRGETPTVRRIATGSPRRRVQANVWLKNIEWMELRGNVETRLKKIADGAADATFLAAAGLERLGIACPPGLVFEKLPVERMVPAAGQGAIALECRAENAGWFGLALCGKTMREVAVERAGLAALGGGCQSSSAVHFQGDELHVFHEPGGAKIFRIAEAETAAAMTAAVAQIKKWLGTR